MAIANLVVPTYVPFGVADPECIFGVISNFNGGLDKLDLMSGNSVWHSSVGLHPLLILGKLVFAEVESKNANIFEVVSIDLDSNKPRGTRFHFRLPDWSHYSSPERQNFSCKLCAQGSHFLVLEWTVNCGYSGGAPAPSSIRNEKQIRVDGVSHLDMLNDHCESFPKSSRFKVPEAEESKATPISFRLLGKWSDQPFESDASIVQLVGDETSLFVIRRNQSNIAAQESRLLFEGRWSAPTVTPDGRLLVVQRRTAANEDESNWEVISLVSGHLVCRFDSKLHPELCCAIGTQLFYITTNPAGESQYCNRSLETGRLQWQKALPQPTRHPAPPPLKM